MTEIAPLKTIRSVLDFWFGTLDSEGCASPETREYWSIKDPDFDREIQKKFEGLYREIVAGEHEDWLETTEGRVAYVVVIDQMPRNMYRGTEKMYASDEQALSVCLDAIEKGRDTQALFAHRNFLYMPLMHSENITVQDQCVALYTSWSDEVDGEQKEDVERRIGFAIRHRDIVARFGRFPHRNQILGRASTAEETLFLHQPGSSF